MDEKDGIHRVHKSERKSVRKDYEKVLQFLVKANCM